jgi:hypothetical protein
MDGKLVSVIGVRLGGCIMKLMKSRIWGAALAVSLTLSVLSGCGQKTPEPEPEPTPERGAGIQVGYATEGITAVEDPEAMSKALDEAYEKMQDERITLSYRNDAFSEDGQTFSCYIANSEENKYDMFIGIYADMGLTDSLYLSQLLRPGTAFETITLNRALEPGKHQVCVVFTTVETTEDEQIIHGETAVTMNFTVKS